MFRAASNSVCWAVKPEQLELNVVWVPASTFRFTFDANALSGVVVGR